MAGSPQPSQLPAPTPQAPGCPWEGLLAAPGSPRAALGEGEVVLGRNNLIRASPQKSSPSGNSTGGEGPGQGHVPWQGSATHGTQQMTAARRVRDAHRLQRVSSGEYALPRGSMPTESTPQGGVSQPHGAGANCPRASTQPKQSWAWGGWDPTLQSQGLPAREGKPTQGAGEHGAPTLPVTMAQEREGPRGSCPGPSSTLAAWHEAARGPKEQEQPLSLTQVYTPHTRGQDAQAAHQTG